MCSFITCFFMRLFQENALSHGLHLSIWHQVYTWCCQNLHQRFQYIVGRVFPRVIFSFVQSCVATIRSAALFTPGPFQPVASFDKDEEDFRRNNLQHSDRHFNLVLLMQSRMVCRQGCPYPWPSTTCDTPSGAICPQSPSVKRSIEPDNYLLSLIGTRFLRDVHVPAERLRRSEHKMLIVIHGGHAAPVWALMSR